ncbi:unnamed protein product [Clonostachys rosea f. rosea IK726]|uniref:Uncharacterized protein n=1 Tax=Clonostachys rosea f. rosea IK726 TaxID=1349383 RepID=A0ACA9UGI5_BIOOC|nr:unnamed protein product [Clonostachys rosea f. rosea IK726]
MASDEIQEPSSINSRKRPAPDEHPPAESQGSDAPKASTSAPRRKVPKTKGEKLLDKITETPRHLIPSNKFRLYNGEWGLLVRRWHEHRGCIDVDVVSAYIAAYKTYEKEVKKRNKDENAQPLTKPTLSDYTTGDTVSHCVWDVLCHEDSEEMKAPVPDFSFYD